MVAIAGKKAQLRMSDGAVEPSMLTLGGVEKVTMRVQRNLHDRQPISEDAWQKVSEQGGATQLQLSLSGKVDVNTAEQRLQQISLGNVAEHFELVQGDGRVISGSFVVQSYTREASYEKMIRYAVTLVSCGEVALS